MASALNDMIDDMRRQVGKQPKKAAALGMLVLLMAVLWGKALMPKATAPKAADASAASAAVNGDKPKVRENPSNPADRQAFVSWLTTPASSGVRNLFAMRPELLPALAGSGTNGPKEISDQTAKSQAPEADQERARRVLVEEMRRLAAKLELQSTMMGREPRALINGSFVAEGETIDGFRVLKIDVRRVIVEREGVKLEVLFKQK